MKRRAIASVAAAVAIIVSFIPATSHAKPGKASATYLATPALMRGFGDLGQPYGYGGFTFEPKGRPTHIKIEDINGNQIAWAACQEGPSQEGESATTCGDGDDVTATECSTGKFQKLRGLYPKQDVSVFIFVNNPGVWAAANCDGIGVGGIVTLKWR